MYSAHFQLKVWIIISSHMLQSNTISSPSLSYSSASSSYLYTSFEHSYSKFRSESQRESKINSNLFLSRKLSGR